MYNNWLAIRTAYLVQGWTLQRCADEFHRDLTTIKKRASKEGWAAERYQITTFATQSATDEARAQITEAVKVIRRKHAELVARMHSVLEGIEDDVVATKPGRSRAETRRAGMESFRIAVTMGRLALGISEGQSSVGESSEESDHKLEIVVVDPEQQQHEIA